MPSLVFRLSLVYSKFTLNAGIQPFGPKTTSHNKPDLKNTFWGSDLRYDEVMVEVQGEVPVQGDTVYHHLPVLLGYSFFCLENHFTLQIWPKIFPVLTLNLTETQI